MTNTTLRSADFLASFGVDTHVPYTDGGYANTANIAADLKYLGISTVRDGISDGAWGSAPLSSYIALARQGITFTITIGGGTMTTADLTAQLALVQRLVQAVPGSVVAIEGPNEINNWPVTYNGVGGLAGAVALQRDLYAAVHGSAVLAGVAVDYFTGYGAGGVANGPNPANTAGLADFDAQHPYPNFGQAPAAWVDPANAVGNEAAGSRGPLVYTETGYSSNGGTAGAVSPLVQAKYTLDLLLDTFKDGVARTDLYELMDAYATGSPQGNDGFGLFGYGNVAKPVAQALHNLTSILADPGQTARSFATDAFGPVVSGLPSTGNDIVLQKSNGTFDIALWAEPTIWNQSTGSEIAAPSTTVTVNLGAVYANVSIYDPLLGAAATATFGNARSVQVAVSDHPVIVEVSGGVVAPLPPTIVSAPATPSPPTVAQTNVPATPPATVTSPAPIVSTVSALSGAGTGITVTDTASDIGNGLGTLRDHVSSIASIVVTAGKLDVQAAAFVQNRAVLDKVVGGFTVSDRSDAILQFLDTLSADGNVQAISTTGAINVSAATYLADRTGLDKLVYGFGVTDTAANLAGIAATVQADTKVLRVTTAPDPSVAPVLVPTVVTPAPPSIIAAAPVSTVSTPTVAQTVATTAPVVVPASPTSVSPVASPAPTATTTVNALPAAGVGVHVADTASNIGNGLGTLRDYRGSIASIVVTSGALDVQAAAFVKNRAVLDKVVGGFTVSDRSDAILQSLDALAADGNIQAISTTGVINVSAATYLADRAGLDKLVYGFGVTDTAANLAGIATNDASMTSVTTTSGGVAVAKDVRATDGSHSVTITGDGVTLAADHNDTYMATGHNATIVFAQAGFGHETFSGYTAGDTFAFSRSLFSDFGHLSLRAAGSDVLISMAGGDSLTVSGVALGNVTAAMFKFG